MDDPKERLPSAAAGPSHAVGMEIDSGDKASRRDVQANDLASVIASYAEQDPKFLVELDALSMTVDDYERTLADGGPFITTTDETAG